VPSGAHQVALSLLVSLSAERCEWAARCSPARRLHSPVSRPL